MALTKCKVWENFSGENGIDSDNMYYGYPNTNTFPSSKNAARFIYKDNNGTEHWILGSKCTDTNTQSYINVSNYEQTNTNPYLSNAKLILSGGFPTFGRRLFSVNNNDKVKTSTTDHKQNAKTIEITWSKNSLWLGNTIYTGDDFEEGVIPKKLIVILQGAGGGGGGVCTDGWSDEGGGGGGAGGNVIAVLTKKDPDKNYYIKCWIGAGGAGGPTSDDEDECTGVQGGDTIVEFWESVTLVTILTAYGGYGGLGSDSSVHGEGGVGGPCGRSPDDITDYLSYYKNTTGIDGFPGGMSIDDSSKFPDPSTASISATVNYSTYSKVQSIGGRWSGSDDYPGVGGPSPYDSGGYGGDPFRRSYGKDGSGGEGGNVRESTKQNGAHGGGGLIEIYY